MERVAAKHVAEAVEYRSLDRSLLEPRNDRRLESRSEFAGFP